MSRWKLLTGDALVVLPTLDDESVHMCVTSPPYYGLRDYEAEGQIGLEKTPDEYVAKLVDVFREVRRVLRPDGTLWLNLGDSFANDTKWGGSTGGIHAKKLHGGTAVGRSRRETGLKPKDLIGIPWKVAFALQADGWWLRMDIIWHKPNPMPESVLDRPTKSHEYLFLLSKSEHYFYDAFAIREPHVDKRSTKAGKNARRGQARMKPTGKDDSVDRWYSVGGRNARSVWTIPVKPFTEEHYATFPEALPYRAIQAGTSEKGACVTCGAPVERVVERPKVERTAEVVPNHRDAGLTNGHGFDRTEMSHYKLSEWLEENPPLHVGWKPTCRCAASIEPATVLDPFAGAATTGRAALALQRRFVGIELTHAACDIGRRRLANDSPLLDHIANQEGPHR